MKERSRDLETTKMQPQEHGDEDSELVKAFQMFDEIDFSVAENVELSIKCVDDSLAKQLGPSQDWYSTG